MPKIYLSPAAHGADNPCSYDKACGENKHCNLYMDELERYLKACGFDVKRAPKTNTGNKVANSIKESNAFKPDIHYVAHTNAGGGKAKGSRPMVWDKGGLADKLMNSINARLKGFYPYELRPAVEDRRWDEIRLTTASALYEEMVFHDNPDDIKWFHQNYKERAKRVAMAFCDTFGIAFKDPDTPAPAPKPAQQTNSGKLYRVQVGAFANKANADKLVAELKGKGYPAFVVES